MNKYLLILTFIYWAIINLAAQEPINFPTPSTEPSAAQQEQINRKYGMFIHFGINTFNNVEWSNGDLPVSSYTPKTIDAKQWVQTARDAGMRYIILVTKHHDGFCLWDSKFTTYDVGNTSNPTNVVEEVARECKRQGIALGLYYSLWDRKENVDVGNPLVDHIYNKYMMNQLQELIDITKKHVDLVEFWFDGGWAKQNYRWPIEKIYTTIKKQFPKCQIGINGTIGMPDIPDKWVYPDQQKEGYPIRYFPSDFRLRDPYLPGNPDPKLFSYQGQMYYMPFETTITLGKYWFYNTKDNKFKTVDELVSLFKKATAQDNIMIINCSPNREGKIRDENVELLKKLRKEINPYIN